MLHDISNEPADIVVVSRNKNRLGLHRSFRSQQHLCQNPKAVACSTRTDRVGPFPDWEREIHALWNAERPMSQGDVRRASFTSIFLP